MHRRQFLTLGAIGSGIFALGGLTRLGGTRAIAQTVQVPTVDALGRDARAGLAETVSPRLV